MDIRPPPRNEKPSSVAGDHHEGERYIKSKAYAYFRWSQWQTQYVRPAKGWFARFLSGSIYRFLRLHRDQESIARWVSEYEVTERRLRAVDNAEVWR